MEKKIKVLNLYAGIGGNRKLWKNVDVTAVEIDENIAKIYQDFFPEDKIFMSHYEKAIRCPGNTKRQIALHRTLIKSDNFSVANCLNIIKMLSII